MTANLDPFEEAVVVAVIQNFCHQLGYASGQKLGAALEARNADVSSALTSQLVHHKAVAADKRTLIAREAFGLLLEREAAVLAMVGKYEPHSVTYLKAVFDRHLGRPSTINPATLPSKLNAIVANWQMSSRTPLPSYWSGAYQMVRRYKPITYATNNSPQERSDQARPEQEVVIWEILFIDAIRHEAILVTSELYVYHGSIFQNHENIMAMLFQRIVRDGKVNQRYLTSKFGDLDLPLHSGICVKVGDKSFRPLASDALFVPLPEEEHPELYAALRARSEEPWLNSHPELVPKESIITDYVSDNPPLRPFKENDVAWKRVTFLSEFPELSALAKENRAGVTYFRQPTRTVAHDDLVAIGNSQPPQYFRHSTTKRGVVRS